jgi:hypothetical protein
MEEGQDLYGDADSMPSEGGAEKSSGGKTAMINKEVCGGKEYKAGEEIRLRIVKDHGNELEVECTGSEEMEEPSESYGAPEGGSGEMQSMLGD